MTVRAADELDGSATAGRWLASLSDNWPLAVLRLIAEREPAVVRVLIAAVRGSAPREPGACMLVAHDRTYGTIGGGNLEWQGLREAAALLTAPATARPVRLRRLVLGRELAQCCGGVVQLWLERFTSADLPLLRRAAQAWSDGSPAAIVTEISALAVMRRLAPPLQPRLQLNCADDESAVLCEAIGTDAPPLWLYGAGHVGQAVIRILAGLPFTVTWIDPRPQLLPALPHSIRALCSATPVSTVPLAPCAARFLVMTHDHALDYTLCRRILERGDFAWLGLIGSKSKGARFRSRLARDGLAPQTIGRLVCPIGVAGVGSKLPAAIAVGVAAQLLQGLGPVLSTRSRNLPLAIAAGPADGCPSPGCAACSAAIS
ncbi:MAG TPA: xanthine dehydrogenase accessory protein XdhC [Steroidobacteraceae bacterium]